MIGNKMLFCKKRIISFQVLLHWNHVTKYYVAVQKLLHLYIYLWNFIFEFWSVAILFIFYLLFLKGH